MSFLNYLNEKNNNDLVDYIIESVSVDVLEEAIENFADLPNAWKKILSRRSNAGENSEIETFKYQVKNEASFNKAISDAFKKSVESSYIIVEVENQPFALLYNTNSEYDPEKFALTTLDGKSITIQRYVNGTRKNNYKGYYVPKTYFKTNEAKDKLKDEVLGFAKSVIEDGDNIEWADLFKKLSINIVLVKPDTIRSVVASKRKDNKAFVDNLNTNKKKVIRKFMVDVVENIIEDIKNTSIIVKDANEILDDILEGKKVDFTSIKDNQTTVANKFSELSRILDAFKSAYSSGKIMDTNYWDEKGKAGMNIRYLLTKIKEYEDTYNSK